MLENGSGPAAVATACEPRELDQPGGLFGSHAPIQIPAQAILRPHQVHLIAQIDAAIVAGERRIVAQAPTGFGKTIVAAAITRQALEQNQRVIFTVPAISLIDQTVEKFWNEGIRDVGVIQASHPSTDYSRPIQIASVQTLQRRYRAIDQLSRSVPAADLVLVDEVHRWFDFYEEWLSSAAMADVPVIGLTATPWTRGLGKHFNRLIVGASTKELIDGKYLSPFRVFAPASPDLSGVRIVAGDYREDDLGQAMNKAELVADVVDTWIERGQNRPTLCFAVDRAHAKHLQAKFQAAGIVAGYIDAYTARTERNRIAEAFHHGDIKVVCNVGCLTTGIDWDVRCIILARPTKSEILFVQMIGRGLRTADGKGDCLILDHSDSRTEGTYVTPEKMPQLFVPQAASNTGMPVLRLQAGAEVHGGQRCRRSHRTDRSQHHQCGGAGTGQNPLVSGAEMLRRQSPIQGGLGRLQVQGKVRALAARARAPSAD
jgi:superfamily II DNA or RNA helicase